MSFSLFSMDEREPSSRVGFAGNRIVRQSEHRDDGSATRALSDPSAAMFILGQGRAFMKVGEGKPDPLFRPGETERFKPRLDEAVLLGTMDAIPVLAVPSGIAPEQAPEGCKAIDHRSIYVQGLLAPDLLGALAQGVAMLAWHGDNRYCGRCGATTVMRGGGAKRHCPSCDRELFPRTDPVAIMLTVTRERCLLARGRHFAPGMYSCLAGFIEPGETIEDAVRRETLEESGIHTGRVAYHASQPWPFPHSLMIGCFAEALGEEIARDDAELEECRWFSREETLSMLAGVHPDGLFVPPGGAIATHLIRAWAEAD